MGEIKFGPSAVNFRRTVTPEQQEAKLKEASQMYEKQFLGEMLKAMRGTVHESGFIKSSQAEKIFRSQLDDNYLDQWVKQGGVGFADVIYKQVAEKYGQQLGIRKAVEKPQGPISLDSSANTSIQYRKTEDKNRLSYDFKVESLAGPQALSQDSQAAIVAPWKGKLLGVYQLSAQEYAIDLAHDNGLKSRMSFKGLANAASPGQNIEAGQRLGSLAPEFSSFHWTLDPSGANVSE